MKKVIAVVVMMGLFSGCASWQQVGRNVSAGAMTASQLAYALDDVYVALIQAKAIPNHQATAVKALAALDAIAPIVTSQGDALAGDQFNWVSFVISAAMATVKAMDIWR